MRLLGPSAAPEQSGGGARPADSSRRRERPSSRRWLRRFLIVIVACFALDWSLSLLLESGWLHQALTRKLEAAFGRPVEVSHYAFGLLEGPRLEANRITVAEDPRFGNEYFLRADQLAVGLRWTALLRGRIELGTLSFTGPRLNLVRLADGEWNLESWLPRPRGNLPAVPAPGRASVRLDRIDVSDGRVDFKQGPDKLPFAFAAVQGSLEQISPGSWRIDLQAQPFRAAAVVQQAGIVSLSGLVGGTSSRLRPAALELDWGDASLSDVSRLLRGTDYGVRGLFSLQLSARTVGDDWNFSSRAQFRELHRWDLPLRSRDPAANLNIVARWAPDKSRFELTQAILETPRSNIHATGALSWTAVPNSMQLAVKNARMEISSTGVQMTDALAWYRAFHRGVARPLALNGAATLDFALAGWPLRIQNGIVASQGIELIGGGRPVPIRMGRASLVLSRNSLSFPPATISIGIASGRFVLRGSAERLPQWHSAGQLNGQTSEVRALLGAAGALGFGLPPGWLIEGPAEFHLQWRGAHWSMIRHPRGTITLAGLKIHAPFLNHEITRVAGAVQLAPSGVKIQLSSADAFAANWRGALQRSAPNGEWQFALSANELSAAEMDRWLNPQRRVSFLDRVLPFLAAKPQPPLPVPSWLRGHGSVSLGRFTLAPFTLDKLQAQASVNGRKLQLANAQAGFYGGQLLGSIALDLTAQPAYDVAAKFHRVDLSLLAARTFSLSRLFAGTASGNLQISAKGIGRAALLRSLACRGDARIRNAQYKGLDLAASLRAGASRPGTTSFVAASSNFVCAAGQVHFSRLRLESRGAAYSAAGYVDFNRQMNFKLRALPDRSRASASAVDAANDAEGDAADHDLTGASANRNPAGVFELTGALKSPKLAPIAPRTSSSRQSR